MCRRSLILWVLLAVSGLLPLRAMGEGEARDAGRVVGAMLVCMATVGERGERGVRVSRRDAFRGSFCNRCGEDTHIDAAPELEDVRADDEALFEHPFTVMSGEGEFVLSDRQRENLRVYLEAGGFIIASAGVQFTGVEHESFA